MATLRNLSGSNNTSSSSAGKRISSRHYFQGGYEYQFVDEVDRRFECPICLLCLRDPHQTSCGHRFCYTCILTWLSEGKTCPHDNCTIGEGDLYPDAIANREILQLRVKCPNSKSRGCCTILNLSDMMVHERTCQEKSSSQPGPQPADLTTANPEKESLTCPSCGELLDEEFSNNVTSGRHNLICPNAEVACPLASIGCQDPIPRAELHDHVQSSVVRHVQLLWERLQKLEQIQSTNYPSQQEATGNRRRSSSGRAPNTPQLPDRDMMRDDVLRLSGSNIHSNQRLIKELFQRVVTLEQKEREVEIVNQNLRGQLRELRLLYGSQEEEKWEMIGRNCHGKFTWKICRFSEFHERMRHNHSFVLYSRSFYTHPFGYRMCLRSNIHIIEGEEYLGLFVHMMNGENDDTLPWPFNGKIVLTIKNNDETRLYKEDFSETMVTPTAGSSAFQKPSKWPSERNPVGFGLQEFIRVNGLYSGGFVSQPNWFKGTDEKNSTDLLVVRAKVVCSEDN